VLTRHGASPGLIQEARAELKAANLEARIHAAVDTWPPLTAEQRADLAILLAPADGG
jgi:hypothetical protein